MNIHERTGIGEQQKPETPPRQRGHCVESELVAELGLTIYVPSMTELQGKSDVVQPFQGTLLGREFGFPCGVEVGTALMRLIHSFGLPNAPEYHDWSDDFMNLGREGTLWEYIFQVNGTQYLFVSHENEELTVGCKSAFDKKTCAAFARFIESVVNS